MMSGMLTTLKGGVLWAVVIIVLAVLGAATYLSSQAILSGSDWLVLGTAVLASVGIVTGAHVASQAAVTALNTPAPGQATVPPVTTAPAPAPSPYSAPVPASEPAMPGPAI